MAYYSTSAILYFRKVRASITIKEKTKFRILGFFLLFIIAATVFEAIILPIAFNLSSRGPVFTLSSREIEVIEEIIRGRTNIEIADTLSIAEKTVKTHITHIFAKLGVENRFQLFYLLKENHFITGQTADKNLIILD